MINRPKFKQHFHLKIEDDCIVLLSEHSKQSVEGRVPVLIAPLLNGDLTTDELIGSLHPLADPAEIYYTLMKMEERGLIVESTSKTPDPSEAFWHSLGIDFSDLQVQLSRHSVSVTSLGNTPTEGLVMALNSLGIKVSQENSSLKIVVADDYLQDDLMEINSRCLKNKEPWILVKPAGNIVWMGPVFYPGRTACWECLAQRMRGNREAYVYFHKGGRTADSSSFPNPALPTGLNISYSYLAMEIAKWFVLREKHDLESTLITYDLLNHTSQKHHVTKRPQCCKCGAEGPAVSGKEIFHLRPNPKRFTGDAGHRTIPPSLTYQRLQKHISPITGVISKLVACEPEDVLGVHVYFADHAFPAGVEMNSWKLFQESVKRKSGGKGMTDKQARVSAMCEAIERYAGIYQGDEPFIPGSYKQLQASAIDPNECLNYSEKQFRDRDEWNRRGNFFENVPLPFDKEAVLDWTPLWSLTKKEWKYLPSSYCYYNYTREGGTRFFIPNSNGCASGNTIEEAILQGFLELVERDSVALWWYNRLRRPKVNLDSFNEPYINHIRQYYHSINRDLWVMDITSDLGIPAFAAVSRRTDKPVEDIVLGFGAHLDPRIAIIRCLTEQNQFLSSLIGVGANDANYKYAEKAAVHWWRTATIENQPYLLPGEELPEVTRSDFKQLHTDDIAKDVQVCVDIAAKQGLDTLILDQSRPDVELQVARVVVPGLRLFWPRLGPGRLYDVPVKMGWLSAPKKEEEMNPIGIYF